MRKNLPITQREYRLPDDCTLLSTTDTHSHIQYANEAFVSVSGFSREELAQQPHNIVRHPDMPTAAFADMWATLKSGNSWTGLVKNRRKDGDHYWVRANATPVVRGGNTVGYMSVRTVPTHDEVAGAEALYAKLREGRGHLKLNRGVVMHRGWRAPLSLFKWLSVGWRIRLACLLAVLPLLLALATAAGPAALAAAAVVGALAANVMLQWQIARPLHDAATLSQTVASGQPGKSINLDRIDEIGMLMRTINQAGLNLRSLVDDVNAQVQDVTQASREIESGNVDLSSRTEAQASNLQQTASSMEEMTGTVRQNADNANAANDLAGQAADAARSGGQVVADLAARMREISEASLRIADIVGTIDAIAFQTNILALNASVEAARAGEQGRGFAVVASEVRVLAGRAADAAKEIKLLIASSVEKVEAGSAQTTAANSAIETIVSRVNRVSALIAEINHASREQSQGIGQVNSAVTQLDDMTQKNAALVEQSAAAASSLRERVQNLEQAVGVFKLS